MVGIALATYTHTITVPIRARAVTLPKGIMCNHRSRLTPAPFMNKVSSFALAQTSTLGNTRTQVLRCEYIIMRFIVRVHVQPLKW